MKRVFLLLVLITTISFSSDRYAKQRNVLAVNDLIKAEEKIAHFYEKYLLTEFKIPTLNDLIDDKYLGSNFSVKNKFGDEIAFKNATDLKIKFATKKAKKGTYILDLYKRDLHRDKTTVNTTFDGDYVQASNSFVSFLLDSKEAQNIHAILKTGAVIKKDCNSLVANTYCNYNINTIRWHDASLNWIEYSKIDFEEGNVTVKNTSTLTDSKLDNLPVGTYIYVENGAKYIKLLDNIIRKVN